MAYSKEIKDSIESLPGEAILSFFGKDTSHTAKGFYHSPLNNHDSTPSFHFIKNTNHWKCFSTGQTGGSLIDLAIAIMKHDGLISEGANNDAAYREAMTRLSGLVGTSYQITPATLEDTTYVSARKGETPTNQDFQCVGPLKYAPLIDYGTDQRGIYPAVLHHYCEQWNRYTYYADGKRSLLSFIGFRNILGDANVRNTVLKRNTGQTDISFIDSTGKNIWDEALGKMPRAKVQEYIDNISPTSDKLIIFEGFIDFLSYICNKNKENIKDGKPMDIRPDGDVIILNSTSQAKHIEKLIGKYKTIHTYLDNDMAGVKGTVDLARMRGDNLGISFTLTDEDRKAFEQLLSKKIYERFEKLYGILKLAKGENEEMNDEENEHLRRAVSTGFEECRFKFGESDSGTEIIDNFIKSLTSENFFDKCRYHRVENEAYLTVLRRLSSSRRGSLVLASEYAKALGFHSLSYDTFPHHNDFNEFWCETAREKIERTEKPQEEKKTEKEDKTEDEGEDTEKPNTEIEKNYHMLTIKTPADSIALQKKNEGVIPFKFTPYTPSKETVNRLKALPWGLISKIFFIEPNLNNFIEDQSKRGYGVLEAFAYGGITYRPIPRFLPSPLNESNVPFSLFRIPSYECLMNIGNIEMEKKANRPQAITVDVVYAMEDLRAKPKAGQEIGDFIRKEIVEKGYTVKPLDINDRLFYGKDKLSKEISKELVRTGRYSHLIDPVSLQPFIIHTDENSNEYTLAMSGGKDANGNEYKQNDLLKNGNLLCRRDNSVMLVLSEYNTKTPLGISYKTISDRITKFPYIGNKGECIKLNDDEVTALVNANDVTKTIDGETVSLHYDALHSQIVCGKSLDLCIQEEMAIKKQQSLQESITPGKSQSAQRKP